MRDAAGSTAAPAARCRKLRRGSFISIPPSLVCVFDHLVGAAEQAWRKVQERLSHTRNRSSAREVLNVRWQHCPSAHLLLPDRRDGRREIAIVETPHRNTKLIWTQIESPADRRPAGGTEVIVQFASLWTLSGIDSSLALKPNLRLLEIGVAG